MAEISAKTVQALREKTGLPLMDVKRALVEAAGDQEKAVEVLRKRFADKMISKADRVAANGRIGAFADGRGGALVEVRCETDFVAGNDVFKNFADAVARQVVETGATAPADLLASHVAFSANKTVQALLEEAFSRLGEKLELSRAVRLEGPCASYVHFNGKIGAVVRTSAPAGEFGRQACMHVASQQGTFWLARDQVPADLVHAEREKALGEIKGKPPQIAEKIVEGKLNKWYSALVLPEQPFALDDKKTVRQAAQEAGVEVTGFLRLEVGRID